jgi:hypothetical protein
VDHSSNMSEPISYMTQPIEEVEEDINEDKAK